jgi:hypothetical protein
VSKVLLTGDLHLKNYSKYNKTPRSRLNQFLTLAHLMCDNIEEEDIEAMIIAGDLLDEAAPSDTIVFHYLHKFFRVFNERTPDHFKLYIVSGNHDINSKSEISPEHTYYSNLNYPKIEYLHRESRMIGGKKFWFQGWEPCGVDYNIDCDVFVNHAYVNGVTLQNGVTAQGGVDIDGKASLFVIGDIHKWQHRDKILLPGTPMQNSYSDHPDTGWNVLDTSDMSIKRVSTANNPDFIKFCYSDDSRVKPVMEKLQETEHTNKISEHLLDKHNIVYKERTDKIAELSEFDIKKLGNLNVSDILEDLVKDFQWKDELYKCIGKNAKAIDSFANQELKVKLKKITIKDFKSIDNFEIDFSNLNPLTIITGENGAGKTSFFEAIIWALTGESHAEVEDVIQTGKSYCQVDLNLEYNGQEISISRSRGSKFEFHVTSNGKAEVADSKSDLQKKLNEMIPAIHKLHLLYFHQARKGILSELNDAARVSLISELSGQSIVAELSESVEAKVAELKKLFESASITYKNWDSKVSGLKSVYKEVEDPSIELAAVESKVRISEEKKQTHYRQKLEVSNKMTQEFAQRSSEIEDQLRQSSVKQESLLRDIYNIKVSMTVDSSIVSRKPEWTCDKCGTTLKAEDFDAEKIEQARIRLGHSQKQIEELNSKITSLKELSNKVSAIRAEENKDLQKKILQTTESIEVKIKEVQSEILEIQKIQHELLMRKGEYVKSIEIKEALIKSELQLASAEKDYKQTEAKYKGFKDINDRVFGNEGLISAIILEKLAVSINTDENIKIKTTRILKNGKIKPTLDLDMYDKVKGYWTPYRSISGGEKLLADTKLLAGIINTVGGIGFLLLDEILKFSSIEFKEKILNTLQNIAINNAFLIYHGEIPSELVDYTLIKAEKTENGSSYQILQK